MPLCPVAPGTAWYLGTCPDAAAMRRITQAAAVTAVPPGLPGSVETVLRDGPDASYFFLLNHGAAVVVTLPEPASAGFGDGVLEDVTPAAARARRAGPARSRSWLSLFFLTAA